MVAIAAFYAFVSLPDAAQLRPLLLALSEAHGLAGTILLASEGINGTVAAAPAALEAWLAALTDGPLFAGRLAGLDVKHSVARTPPFARLKVKLKREIVALGAAAADPAVRTGTAVDPAAWHALLDDPAVTVLDTRNAFEVAMGTFAGAVDPGLQRFGDFPRFAARALDPDRHRTVAMFCTGGIRCEKASALLLNRGFDRVYQLRGGILRYLETMPAAASRWRGTCFVFDERVSLGHGLTVTGPGMAPP